MFDFKLPSQHQIGDKVLFTFWFDVKEAEVHGVYFSPGKVLYDLIVFGKSNDEMRLYRVDSVYVSKIKYQPQAKE